MRYARARRLIRRKLARKEEALALMLSMKEDLLEQLELAQEELDSLNLVASSKPSPSTELNISLQSSLKPGRRISIHELGDAGLTSFQWSQTVRPNDLITGSGPTLPGFR